MTCPMTSLLPYPPVDQLVAFVRVHVAEVLQQVVQGVPAEVEGAGSLVSVKHVDHVQPKVLLQPLYV